MSTLATLALVVAVACIAALGRAYRPDPEAAERWRAARGLSPGTAAVVARHLRRARLFRTWGGVARAVLPTAIDLVVNDRFQVLGFGADGTSAPLGFGAIYIGYLVGALAAELTLPRRRGARRRASLTPRDLRDYLPRRVVLAQRALAVGAALGTLAIGLVPYPAGTSNPGPDALAAIAAAMLAFGAAIETIERRLVRRPQPYTTPELVAADDAIRAQSIRAFARAAAALLLLYGCGVALALQASENAFLQAAMPVPAGLLLVLSLLVAAEAGEGTWRVRAA